MDTAELGHIQNHILNDRDDKSKLEGRSAESSPILARKAKDRRFKMMMFDTENDTDISALRD